MKSAMQNSGKKMVYCRNGDLSASVFRNSLRVEFFPENRLQKLLVGAIQKQLGHLVSHFYVGGHCKLGADQKFTEDIKGQEILALIGAFLYAFGYIISYFALQNEKFVVAVFRLRNCGRNWFRFGLCNTSCYGF